MHANALRWISLAVILAIAVLRTTVMLLVVPVFDVDPARDPTVGVGIGPAMSLFLDAALFAASALALVAEVRAGRRLQPSCVVLAVLPCISILWWASSDAMDAFRGMTWLSGACAFVALSHLVRDRGMRVVAVSVLIAVMAPLAARGLEQAYLEHPATVSQFEATKAQLFAERGWEADSSAARSYTRRLTQREATGWFGLSNPYSSVMACATVVLLCASVTAWRSRGKASWSHERVASGISLTLFLCALLALSMLLLNLGKGAIAAMLLGSVALIWGLFGRGMAQPRWILLGACLAFAAMIARSFLGESFGETSLYLRGLYLDGALRAFELSPRVGVGPDGLQSVFMQCKPANCPEDVQSAHSIFVDWLVFLGPLGIAWVVMLGLSMRSAFAREHAAEEDASELSRVAMRIGLGIVVIGLVSQARVEAPILDAFSLCVRAAGWMLFVGLAACIAFVLASASSRVLAAAVVAAGVVVLAHAQIEMTFFLPGTAVWMCAVLACATTLVVPAPTPALAEAALHASCDRRSQWLALAPIGLCACAVYFGVREYQVEQRLERAAQIVRPLAEVREAWSELSKSVARGTATEAMVDRCLDAVALASVPVELQSDAGSVAFVARVEDALSTRNLEGLASTLVRLDVALRTLAAQELLAHSPEAAESEWNRLPREAAVKQLAVAGRRALGAGGAEFDAASLDAAIALTREAGSPRAGLRMLFMRCDLLWERMQAQRRNGASDAEIRLSAEAMLSDFTSAAVASPYAPMRWVLLGDLQEIAGQFELARGSWKRAQVVNTALHLDPLAQLPARVLVGLDSK